LKESVFAGDISYTSLSVATFIFGEGHGEKGPARKKSKKGNN